MGFTVLSLPCTSEQSPCTTRSGHVPPHLSVGRAGEATACCFHDDQQFWGESHCRTLPQGASKPGPDYAHISNASADATGSRKWGSAPKMREEEPETAATRAIALLLFQAGQLTEKQMQGRPQQDYTSMHQECGTALVLAARSYRKMSRGAFAFPLLANTILFTPNIDPLLFLKKNNNNKMTKVA